MNELTVELPVGLKGFFKLIRRREDLSIVEETPWMPNLVLNTGKDYIGGFYSASSWHLNGCHVGSSNAAVVGTQSGMQSFVAGTVTFFGTGWDSSTAYPDAYSYNVTTFRFGVGVAAGNLAEVGVAIGASSGGNSAALPTQPCFSRALIVDGGGTPVTITVLPTEILDVIYTIRAYAPTADVVGNFTVVQDGTPVNYSYTFRPSTNTTGIVWNTGFTQAFTWSPSIGTSGSMSNFGSGTSNGTIGSNFTALSGSQQNFFNTFTQAGYTAGNYFRDIEWLADVSNSNYVGGITGMKFNFGVCGFMMAVSPGIPKTNLQQFRITTRISWDNVP